MNAKMKTCDGRYYKTNEFGFPACFNLFDFVVVQRRRKNCFPQKKKKKEAITP